MLFQAESANFISRDTLQSAIESALNQRSLFNFAIDLEGNRYVEQYDGSTVIQPADTGEAVANA
jgi:Mitochondrial ribosome subunit S26